MPRDARELSNVARRVDQESMTRDFPELDDVSHGPTRIHDDNVGTASANSVEVSENVIVVKFDCRQECAPGDDSSVVMGSHPLRNTIQHVAADGGVVDVADDATRREELEEGIREGITHRVHVNRRDEFQCSFETDENRGDALAQKSKHGVVSSFEEAPPLEVDELHRSREFDVEAPFRICQYLIWADVRVTSVDDAVVFWVPFLDCTYCSP